MNIRYLVPSLPLVLLYISLCFLCPPILSGFKAICGKVFSDRIEIQITYFLRFVGLFSFRLSVSSMG